MMNYTQYLNNKFQKGGNLDFYAFTSQLPDTVPGNGGDYIRQKQADGTYKYFVDTKDGSSYRPESDVNEWTDTALRYHGYLPQYDEDYENIVGMTPWDKNIYKQYMSEIDAVSNINNPNYNGPKPTGVRSRQTGGIMNYALYLQSGGTVQPSIEEQIAELVQAAMSDDQEAIQQIEQIMQAAKQGDPKAQQIAQLIKQITQKLQQPATMKCGGKVRAKIKKACGGKKMEKGGEAKVKKEAKGGKPCPCTFLKKVGGKLIEVDCEGIPVARDGMRINKFQAPASPIRIIGNNTYTPEQLKAAGAIMDTDGLNKWYYLNPEDNSIYVHGTPLFGNNVFADWKKADASDINKYHQLKGHVKTVSNKWMIPGDNGLYTKSGYANSRYGRSGNSFLSDLGAKDATWNKDKNIWERKGFTYNKGKDGKYTWVPTENEQVTVENSNTNVNNTPKKTAGQLMFERANLGLSDYSLAGRQQWARDNAEYLKTQGWDDTRINGYRGSAVDNRALLQAMQDKSALDQQQELEAMKAQNSGLKKLIPENNYLLVGTKSGNPMISVPTSRVVAAVPSLNRKFYSVNIGDQNLRGTEKYDVNTITPQEALHLRDEEWNKWLQNKFPRLEISNRPIFAGYFPGYKEGGKLNYYKYLQSGGNIPNTHSYKSQSRAEQNIPEETLIDRTGKNPRYTYVPGELKPNLHFKVPTAVPNTEKILGPNEKRMYIDPKTNRVYEIQGREDPNMSFVNYTWSGSPVDQEFDNIGQRPVVGGTQFELPGKDVYLFPNGQVNSVSRSNSTTTIPQPPIIPRIGHIPTNPTDNTSTRGSFEMGDWGNVKGGNYPGTQLPIPAPEGYDPYSQYEKRIDQVNGGTRITYIDKRTGKILKERPQV